MSPERERIRGMAEITGSEVGLGRTPRGIILRCAISYGTSSRNRKLYPISCALRPRPLSIEVPDLYIVQLDARLTEPV